jgi:hypothetical protein
LNYAGVAAHQSLGSFGHRRHLPGSLDPGMKAAEDEGWRGLVWRGYASIRQGGVREEQERATRGVACSRWRGEQQVERLQVGAVCTGVSCSSSMAQSQPALANGEDGMTEDGGSVVQGGVRAARREALLDMHRPRRRGEVRVVVSASPPVSTSRTRCGITSPRPCTAS